MEKEKFLQDCYGNLNAVEIEEAANKQGGAPDPIVCASSKDGMVEAVFKGLEFRVVSEIFKADIIVGCVAWLTSERILDALAEKKGVSIVVQKEDFLRPDIGAPSDWKTRLRKKYDSLPCPPGRQCWENPFVKNLSYCADQTISPIRCCGNHNSEKKPAFPRMHNKFIVFCRASEDGDGGVQIRPYQVWTGSFNFTKNSNHSLENGLIIQHPEIVEAYYLQWGAILAISEPLDWESEWIAPEWRIGS